ncbi:MAG: AsmA-like C-terminal region-containing protein, partial [Bacteroidota bacterium]
GTYSFLNRNEIDLEAVGKDTDIQTLISLLPKEVSEQLEKYQSDGDVFFNLKLKGEISDRKSPLLSTEFGARDATVSHPGFQSVIRHANLEGSFATPSFSDLSQAELFLRNITGELNGKPFEANFSLQDFTDPLVAVDFKGDVDAASLLSFYPIPDVANLSGQLQIDFTMAGRTELLKSKATAQEVRTQGTIQMQDLHMELGKKQVKLEGLNGHLQFNNNDLALSEVKGKLENTDFLLNGHFKNLITFLLFENQPVGVEADLTSEFVDLDQLFEIGFGDRKSDDYLFQLSPYVHLNFNCNVKALSYQRFKPTRVKGNLLIKNQVAVSRDISVNALGGTISLDGLLDAKNPKAIDVVGTFKLRDVHVDSIFYLFHNFDQEFIQDKHLKGQATADVTLEMSLDEKLKLFPETLIADVSTVIKNGQLNNFEPLQQLNRYLDDEGLHKLRFADLKNDIHIENETVFIPQMEIQSNVTTIQLSGTHTFDQHIDYRVVAPLRNRKKIDPDEAFGAIEQDSQGRTKIFLKITGTTDDYDVSLDKEAVRKKIASDFKKEVKELKDAFKLKGAKKKKELELSEEEFDWDNNR